MSWTVSPILKWSVGEMVRGMCVLGSDASTGLVNG